MATSSNDNSRAETRASEPHGVAALLLVESLVHGLIEANVLTTAEAVELIDVATDVSKEMTSERDKAPPQTPDATTLLDAISKSLRHDLDGTTSNPR